MSIAQDSKIPCKLHLHGFLLLCVKLLFYVEDKLINDVRKVAQESISDDKLPMEFFQMTLFAMNEEFYILSGPNGDSCFPPRVRTELMQRLVSGGV